MEAYIWLILASMFAVGLLFGFFFGRGKEVAPTARIRELEENLEEAKQEMDKYRGEVTEHFGKTAELFNQLTNDYRAVYEHLATSSEKLCGDQVEKLKALSSDAGEKPLIESEDVSHAVKAEEPEQEEVKEAAAETMEEKVPEEPIEASAEETELPQEAKSEEMPEGVAEAAAVTDETKLDEKASEARTIH